MDRQKRLTGDWHSRITIRMKVDYFLSQRKWDVLPKGAAWLKSIFYVESYGQCGISGKHTCFGK